MHHYDYAILAAQLVRTLVWLAGCFYSLRFRRWMMASGCGIAAVTSTVFAFSNSGFIVAAWLRSMSNYGSSVAAVLLVAGLILGTKLYTRRKQWTP